MADYLPKINPTSDLGSLVNKMIRHSETNAISKNSDLMVTKDSYGTILKLAPQFRYASNTYMAYQGEWNISSSFSKYDIVRVSATVGGAVKGVWVCVQDVPDLTVSNALKAQGWAEGSAYIRYTDRSYEPKWPEPTSNKYWELISMLPITQQVCEDGVQKDIYVDAWISGSS